VTLVEPAPDNDRKSVLPWLASVVMAAMLLACVKGTDTLRLTPVGWLLPLGASLLILILSATRVHWRFFLPWAPWCLFLFIQALSSPHANALVRCILMVTPLVVGLAASAFAVSVEALETLRRALVVVSIAFLLIFFTRFLFGPAEERLFFPAESISALLLGSLFLVRFLIDRHWASGALWAAVSLVPVLTVSRAATAAAVLTAPLALAPLPLKRRVCLAVALAVAGFAVFSTASFQQKMFFSGSGQLTDILDQGANLQMSGRSVLWLTLLQGVPDSPWFGHGANASEALLLDVAGLSHPHNDYLRILYEFGVLGLVLFGVAVGGTIFALLRLETPLPQFRWWKYALASSFVPYLLIMFTDNVLLYAAFFGNLQFALIGFYVAAMRNRPAFTAVVMMRAGNDLRSGAIVA